MQENNSNWIKSWHDDKNLALPINAVTKNHYQGINILRLWLTSKDTNQWATYRQWQESGKQVKKGEKGTTILRYIQIEKDSKNGEFDVIPIMKVFSVFNAAQLEGYEPVKNQGGNKTFNHLKADVFIANTMADIKFNEQRAFYDPIKDYINMPKKQDFIDTQDAKANESYYSTLFHELIHWTGGEKKLARKQFNINENKKSYAYEELIAELGSCFLCAHLGTEPVIREDHAKYLNIWIEVLQNDDQVLLKAAAAAGKAFDYLLKLQDKKHQDKVA